MPGRCFERPFLGPSGEVGLVVIFVIYIYIMNKTNAVCGIIILCFLLYLITRLVSRSNRRQMEGEMERIRNLLRRSPSSNKMSKKDMERRRDLILKSLVITVSNYGRGNLIDDVSSTALHGNVARNSFIRSTTACSHSSTTLTLLDCTNSIGRSR